MSIGTLKTQDAVFPRVEFVNSERHTWRPRADWRHDSPKRTANRPMDVKPTLSQIWKQDKLISAICVQSVDVHVSCSSHGISELAPFFIDPQAK